MKKNSAALIATILLLLPLLYVGSYLALVVPRGRIVPINSAGWTMLDKVHYRAAPAQAAIVFWPLEKIDRKLRPRAWNQWPGMQLDVF